MSDDLTRGVPKHFIVTPQPDGSTVIERTAADRRRGIGANAMVSVPLYAVFLYFAIPYVQTYEGKLPPLSDPMVGIGIGVLLLGLGQLAGILRQVMGREEWRISEDELRWRGRIFGFAWERRYQGGTLLLRRRYWLDGTATEYRLFIRTAGHRSRSLYTTFNWPAMNQLTRYLAAQLSWPIDQGWK